MDQENDHLVRVGEAVDRLMTVDVTGLWFSQSTDVLGELYRAARARTDAPISLKIARELQSLLREGGTVIINTGLTLPQGFAETDGPPGGAALGRAIQRAHKARVVFVTDDGLEAMMAATCQGAGLSVCTLPRLIELGKVRTIEGGRADQQVVAITGFPFDDAAGQRRAVELLDALQPAAVIAVEKTGCNDKGVYHSMSGMDMSRFRSRGAFLFKEATRRRIMTVAIADGGNEIGMGTIRDVVQRLVPFGRKCQCPCGGGTADATPVDYLLPAMVSNIGAYGVAACIAAVNGDPRILHGPEVERRMTAACIAAGAIDAISHYPEPTSDGLSVEVAVGIIQMLHAIIEEIRVREWPDYAEIFTKAKAPST